MRDGWLDYNTLDFRAALRYSFAMKIALVSGAYPRREVVARGVAHKLESDTVQPFSCVEDALASSMDYDVFVIYNNFTHKMNGIDGVRAIRQRARDAYIIGVSAIPYMERQFVPAGADSFLLLAGNEIAELADAIIKHRQRPAHQPPAVPPPKPSASEPTPAPASPVDEAVLHIENLIYTLERARLLFDYAAGEPDPAELRRYSRVMIAEIERIITYYYSTQTHADDGHSTSAH